MTKHRGQRRAGAAHRGRYTPKREAGPVADQAFCAGWCRSEEDLAEARRQTHDAVIDQLGDRRRGGVRWIEATGEDADRLMGDLRANAGNDMETLGYYRQIGAKLREFGGYVVIATAPGVK